MPSSPLSPGLLCFYTTKTASLNIYYLLCISGTDLVSIVVFFLLHFQCHEESLHIRWSINICPAKLPTSIPIACLFLTKGSSKLPSRMRHSESASSLASEREHITSLDLSANELRDIDALSQKSCISGHLEHLERLELHQNALTGFPQRLSEVNFTCPPHSQHVGRACAFAFNVHG